MKFSNLLGKNIISLAHATDLGTIYSCTVDNKLRRILQIATVDNEENEGYVQNKLINFGEDVLYTVNALADYEQNGILFPFRARVYNTDGKFLGKVADFEFEKNQIIEIRISDDIYIKSSEIVTATGALVIVKGKRKVRAVSSQAKRSKLPLSQPFNEILEDNSFVQGSATTANNLELTQDERSLNAVSLVASDEANPSQLDENLRRSTKTENRVYAGVTILNDTDNSSLQPENNNQDSPRKLISGYQFLLGRKVIKNIIKGGILLIPKDKTIDVDTVELARKHGKLVELTVSSVEK